MNAPPDLRVDVVIPSIGRPSLAVLLNRLGAEPLPPGRVIVVDDSADGSVVLPAGAPANIEVVRTTGGRGPAAARNAGWCRTDAPFVAFLDDDVLPTPGWPADLATDLLDLPPAVAAVQGRISVPRPARASDWERTTARLEEARWITADLVVRREALVQLGGFDERFPRAYREDTDLALRLMDAGWRLERGCRRTLHPVRPAPWWVSVRMQAGNADDALIDRLHHDWRARVGEPRGRFRRHVTLVGTGIAALVCAGRGHRRAAGLLAAAWTAGTGAFAWERIRPGPRSAGEVAAMTLTSVAIPPVAIWQRVRGRLSHRHTPSWSPVD